MLKPKIKKYYNLPISLINESLEKQKEKVMYENTETYDQTSINIELDRNENQFLKLKLSNNLSGLLLNKVVINTYPDSGKISIKSEIEENKIKMGVSEYLYKKEYSLKLKNKERLKNKKILRIFPYYEKLLKEIKFLVSLENILYNIKQKVKLFLNKS